MDMLEIFIKKMPAKSNICKSLSVLLDSESDRIVISAYFYGKMDNGWIINLGNLFQQGV